MTIRDLIPWGRNDETAPVAYRERDPFLALHREVNRLFDDVFRGFERPFRDGPGRLAGFSAAWPSIEVSDDDKEIRVVAELPGLEEQDVEVLLDDDTLTLRGEKKAETEDKDRRFSERFYGRFERRIRLGYEIEDDKVSASFRNGVLTVTLPKSEKAASKAKRIAIGTEKR
ncbi:Molecular chaperone IbpA, HSP20 family [Chelatococcus sambhunathii]|uniref:Molecular chaperone IbpA, HSP20 family n=1 Tax=Chelatococcus sambhunathii TaxID=363953 RepID=A0ABM9U5H1_9HYPH|nr:Hsp20/alpha crystallin family protein [Chelatococcus sambhunathii]CUA87469.1 Molecular chaperone IbpA, HSP20 family [Chelatococcus sambhunathii]